MAEHKAEVATVTVTVRGDSTTIDVPAHTVTLSQFVTRAHTLLRTYIARSLDEREPMSMGDFGLYVLTAAASDPTHIPDSATAIPDVPDISNEDFVPWTDADRAADYGDLLGYPDEKEQEQ